MSVDVRVGKKDYYTRYKVYTADVDITDAISMSNNLIGILHAKDSSAYSVTFDTYSNKWGRDNTRASLETMDKIVLKPNYYLYCITEKQWYIIDSVSENSNNQSQQYSKRPIITRTINIRKAV